MFFCVCFCVFLGGGSCGCGCECVVVRLPSYPTHTHTRTHAHARTPTLRRCTRSTHPHVPTTTNHYQKNIRTKQQQKQCKLPTQAFFTEEFGLPLTMNPNFEDLSCDMVFGAPPPPLELDPAAAQACFVPQCSLAERSVACPKVEPPSG